MESIENRLTIGLKQKKFPELSIYKIYFSAQIIFLFFTFSISCLYAQEFIAEYERINLPFNTKDSGIIELGILAFNSQEGISNFTEEVFDYLNFRNNEDLNNKYVLYSYQTIKNSLDILNIKNLDPESENTIDIIKSNLGIKYLMYGEVLYEKSKIVRVVIKDTESNSVILNHIFQPSVNSNSINDIYILLSENRKSIYSPITLMIVETEPVDAVIQIEDKEYYSNKDSIFLSPGTYALTISGENCEPFKDIIELKPGQVLKKYYPLQQIMEQLKVSIYPPEARVVLKRGNSIIDSWEGHKILKKLNVGEYFIATELYGYEKYENKIYLGPGSNIFEIIYLLPTNSTINDIKFKNKKLIGDLYNHLNKLDSEKQFYDQIRVCNRILSIDPTERHIQLQLATLIASNLDNVLNDADLLKESLTYVDETSIFPLKYLVSHLYEVGDSENLELVVGKVSRADSLFNLFLYFYEKNDEYFMDHIISKMMFADANKLTLSREDLFLINSNINSKYYKKLIEVSPRYFTVKSNWELAIISYISNNSDLMKKYLSDISLEEDNSGLNIYTLLKLDADINLENFKELFSILYKVVSINGFEEFSDTEDLYTFAKKLYLADLKQESLNYLAQIYDSRQAINEELEKQIKWGVGALGVNDSFRAEKIFDYIYVYGKDTDLLKLKEELLWWRNVEFYPEFIETILNRYFINIQIN